jgi:hypothetical protein
MKKPSEGVEGNEGVEEDPKGSKGTKGSLGAQAEMKEAGAPLASHCFCRSGSAG